MIVRLTHVDQVRSSRTLTSVAIEIEKYNPYYGYHNHVGIRTVVALVVIPNEISDHLSVAGQYEPDKNALN